MLLCYGTEKVGHRHRQSSWIKRYGAAADDLRAKDAALRARMMNDDPLVGIDDQIVLDAGNTKIALQLVAQIGHRIPGRQYLDNDNGIRHLDRVAGDGLAAIDQHVRLVAVSCIDANGSAVENESARHTCLRDRTI